MMTVERGASERLSVNLWRRLRSAHALTLRRPEINPTPAKGQSRRRIFSLDLAQYKIEFATPARTAFDANTSAVSDHNFARNRQTQSGSGLPLARHTIKAVKDPALEFFRNAWPLINYAELDREISVMRSAQQDLAAGRRVLQRIGDEIGEDVSNPLAVHPHARQVWFDGAIQLQPFPDNRFAHFLSKRMHQVGWSNLLRAQFGLSKDRPNCARSRLLQPTWCIRLLRK